MMDLLAVLKYRERMLIRKAELAPNGSKRKGIIIEFTKRAKRRKKVKPAPSMYLKHFL